MKRWTENEGVELVTRRVPPPLKFWLEHPSVVNDLGRKVLKHMWREG